MANKQTFIMADKQTYESLTTDELIQILSDKRKFDTLFDNVKAEMWQQKFNELFRTLPKSVVDIIVKYTYGPAPTYDMIDDMIYGHTGCVKQRTREIEKDIRHYNNYIEHFGDDDYWLIGSEDEYLKSITMQPYISNFYIWALCDIAEEKIIRNETRRKKMLKKMLKN